ncbi:MAG: hypothetical protein IT550_08210 [Novosphingobium sp.]|nr:hypothetical protein [Novosphingobium sp.]
MKLRVILAATAALSLAACGKSDESAGAAAQASASAPAAEPSMAPAAVATTAAAPVEPGSEPTKEFLIGKWAEAGECDLALQFNADGTMIGPFERWSLDGGVLAMEGNPSKIHLKVVDPDTMESRLNGTAPPHKLTRCK